VLIGSEVSAALFMLTDSPARSGSTIGVSADTFTVSVIAPTDSVKSTDSVVATRTVIRCTAL
jgi:hypothetical protein